MALLLFASCDKETDTSGGGGNGGGGGGGVVTCSGDLILKNTSKNPYSVEIIFNGSVKATYRVEGASTKTVSGWDKGDYTVKVTQISGYILYPTVETYTGYLSCNGSLKATFPNSKSAEE